MKKTILVMAIFLCLFCSCKVTQPNHTNCKNQKNCPHTNKRYYIEKSKNKNLFW
jgi:hypothetical protein